MYEKRQKMEFLDLKYLLISGFFLSGFGGYPHRPLSGKSSCPKTFSGNGGTPTPLSPWWKIILHNFIPRISHNIMSFMERDKIRLDQVNSANTFLMFCCLYNIWISIFCFVFCGEEEKWRRKRRKIFGEGKKSLNSGIYVDRQITC